MRTQPIQNNSLIGSKEEETGNCGHGEPQTGPVRAQSPFGGPLRRLVGTLALMVASVMAVNDRQVMTSADGWHGLTGQPPMQKADIIDDIVEIIEAIINPPMPPSP